jgi:hypothetical protein
VFEIRFANGDTVTCDSRHQARDEIRKRDVEQHEDADVLPVKIYEDGDLRETFTSWQQLRSLAE